jgi:hypothetical protein
VALHRCCRALYRALLYAYPLPFRKRFGKELMQVFDDRYRSVIQTSGRFGLLRFAVHILTDLLSTTVAETIDSLRPLPQFAIAGGHHFDGVPTFQLCEGDAPRATALMAGAILSLALFNSITFAMEHSRARHWRHDLAISGHQSRLWASGWPARVPSVYAAATAQTGNSTPGQSRIVQDLIAQFDRADVVALGEIHGTKEDADLRLRLIRQPDFPKKVRYIVIEFGNSLHQGILDQYIRGVEVPVTEISKVWRDTTQLQADTPMDSPFLAEVRSVNKGLEDRLKLRVLAGDPPIDWSRIKDREDWRRIASTRDSFAAELVGREVLEKGHKALLIYGAWHFWRNARGGPIPADSTLVPLLDRKYPGRICAVLPIAGGVYPDTKKLEDLLPTTERPVLLLLKGTPFGALDPNEFIGEPLHLPFRLFPPGVTLAEVADACVYRGQTPDTTASANPAVEADPAYAAEIARRRSLIAPPKR